MKDKKIWIIASFICVIAGSVILTVGRMMGGRPGFYIDGIGLHRAGETEDVESVKGFRELEEFSSIELDVDYADVEIVASDRFAVEYCLSGEYGEPVCRVENGKLIFEESSHVRFMNIGFFMAGMETMVNELYYYVKIEIPDDRRFSQVFLDIEDGSLKIPSLQADMLSIKNEYGNVVLDEYEGENLKIGTDSGNLSLGILRTGRTEIKNEYGEIMVSEINCSSLIIKQDSGDCQIDCLTAPDTEIENEYGNVSLGISENIREYSFDLSTEYGRIYMKDEDGEWEQERSDDGMRYRSKGNGKEKLKISCEDGNINIDFVK